VQKDTESQLKQEDSESEQNTDNYKEFVVTLYFYSPEEKGLAAESREVKIQYESELLPVIIGELINGPRTLLLSQTLPLKTRLLDCRVEGDTVYLNFSSEIKTNFYGGAFSEKMLIYSVVNSLTEISDHKKVQFLIEGETIESLAGHVYIGEPLSRNEILIKTRSL